MTETRQEAEGEAAEELIKTMSPEDIETINVQKGKDGENTIKITTKSSSKSMAKSDDKDGSKRVEIRAENKDGKRSKGTKSSKRR